MRQNSQLERKQEDEVLSSGQLSTRREFAFLDDQGALNVVVNEAKNKSNYLDKNVFRKMLMQKGFKGPSFLINNEKRASPKPTGKHFQKLYKDG